MLVRLYKDDSYCDIVIHPENEIAPSHISDYVDTYKFWCAGELGYNYQIIKPYQILRVGTTNIPSNWMPRMDKVNFGKVTLDYMERGR